MNISFSDALSVLVSAFTFQLLNFCAVYYNVIPESVDVKKKMVWFNVLLSLVHSFYASVACVICLCTEPYLAWPSQMDVPGSGLIKTAGLITLGYFFYDLIHTLRSFAARKSIGVIFHHVWVIWGYCIISVDLNKQNPVIIGMIAEINTIFLHIRQLFRLAKVSSQTRIYKVNSWMNFITFIVFRFPAFGWMFFYFFLFTDYTKTYNSAFAMIGCFQMTIFNTILLARLIYTDKFSESKIKE